MQEILPFLKRDLRGLDEEGGVDATPSTLVVGALVVMLPALALMLCAAFAVYFSF